MKQIFKFICCGNVDDGKSTLIGRILLDTGNVKKDQLEDAIKASKKNGSSNLELSMLLDGLLSEREQQITIDVAHRYFDYKNVRFHILDCPGHKQYTQNMAIAAAEADTAIVVIDVTKGIQEQTKKHIQICSIFNIKNICICLTKCDLITDKQNNVDKKRINKITNEINKIMSLYNFMYKIIPVSAVTGYNVNKVISQIYAYAKSDYKIKNKNSNCVIHIQCSKLHNGKRYYYGREINNIEPVIGMEYNLFPNNIPVTITNNISHGCFLVKEDIDISVGDCISNCPVIVSNIVKHETIWFDKPTKNMILKHGTRTVNIVNYTDKILELDNQIIFNNIKDLKQNGFGIIIDALTKKTIGCSVFKNNNIQTPKGEIKNKIYFIKIKSHKKSQNQIENFIKQFNTSPIILDLKDLKKSIIENNDYFETTCSLAHLLKKQGFNVIIIGEEKDILPVKAKPDIILGENNYILKEVNNNE